MTEHTQELREGKGNISLVAGVFHSTPLCLFQVDRHRYALKLQQMFRLGDMNGTGIINFDEYSHYVSAAFSTMSMLTINEMKEKSAWYSNRFVGILRSVAPWFSDLEVSLYFTSRFLFLCTTSNSKNACRWIAIFDVPGGDRAEQGKIVCAGC